MKGGQLSHQGRLFQISRLTLTRSKSRIINFLNSILPYNELQIAYLSLTTFSDITGCFVFILQSSYLQSLPNLELNVTAPGANLTKYLLTIPPPWQNQNRCPSSLPIHARFVWCQIHAKIKTSEPCVMKIVTSFKTTCEQIVTNFKTAIGSIVVSSQLGAQFSLHVILIFVTIFIARCLISVNSGF